MECSDRKTTSRICAGARGAEDQVETSLIKRAPPTAWEVMCRLSEVSMLAASGQDGWSWAFVWFEARVQHVADRVETKMECQAHHEEARRGDRGYPTVALEEREAEKKSHRWATPLPPLSVSFDKISIYQPFILFLFHLSLNHRGYKNFVG
jgi:hypothetical protein